MTDPVVTDYTSDIDTFQPGMLQQYRLMKYFRDLLANWAADLDNIKDSRLHSIFRTRDGKINSSCFRLGTPFDKDSKYAGTTPAFIVSCGDVQHTQFQLNHQGMADPLYNGTAGMYGQRKLVDIGISIVTQDYDSTVLIAQLLQLFLTMNRLNVICDCPMIDSMSVIKVDAPSVVEATQHSKQVYGSTIHITTAGYICWTHDTQGPIFRGLLYKEN